MSPKAEAAPGPAVVDPDFDPKKDSAVTWLSLEAPMVGALLAYAYRSTQFLSIPRTVSLRTLGQMSYPMLSAAPCVMIMFSRVCTVVLRTSALLFDPKLWIRSKRISQIFSKLIEFAAFY